MNSNNEKKCTALGMPYGTANGKLKKKLLFSMAIELNRAVCFRCSKYIENITEFSIEHKIAWLNSDDPVLNFFDLNNIAFSHLKCNIENGERPNKKYDNNISKEKAKYARLKADNKRYSKKLELKRGYYKKFKKENLLEIGS